ncbi:MAG: hypothetical protein SFX73_28990 [Kofleriaceae bacterium]|nr:hypothetical protein [Kofleriaceae bacterium]
MERAQVRDEYARQHKSYGAMTSRDHHARAQGDSPGALRGKGGR